MTAVQLPDPTVEVRADRPVLRAVGDAVVLWLARLAATGWFRRIEVVGLERLRPGHPVIVVANHSNGFVDPLTLMATTPRPLRFLAKATLWKVPGVKWLMAVAGVLPVERRAGRRTAPTATAPSSPPPTSSWPHDGAVAIFPEGTVNDALRLKPLKTGAARIALGARQAGADVAADRARSASSTSTRPGRGRGSSCGPANRSSSTTP